MENKEVKSELENVNGGRIEASSGVYCTNCKKKYSDMTASTRKVEDGCNDYVEYKCPDCGTWNRA